MSHILGRWHLRMKTPIGSIDARYEFTETPGGVEGTAIGEGERTPLRDIEVERTPRR